MVALIEKNGIPAEDEALMIQLLEWLSGLEKENLNTNNLSRLDKHMDFKYISDDNGQLKIVPYYPFSRFFIKYYSWAKEQKVTIIGKSLSKMAIEIGDVNIMREAKICSGKLSDVFDCNLQKSQFDIDNHIKNACKAENKPVVIEQPDHKPTIEFKKIPMSKEEAKNVCIKNRRGSHYSAKNDQNETVVGNINHNRDIRNDQSKVSASIIKVIRTNSPDLMKSDSEQSKKPNGQN